jgi:cell wall-associated NlpC family hydrolase
MNDVVNDQQQQASAPHRVLPDAVRALVLCTALLILALTGCSTVPVSHLPAAGPRTLVVDTAYRMLGTPYIYGGSTPTGFDCSGLAQFSYQQAGLKIPRTAIEQYLRSVPVPDNRLLPGDLLFFTLNSRRVAHVGIYVGDGKFIHAPAEGRHVMQSRLDEPYWQGHLVRAGRLP